MDKIIWIEDRRETVLRLINHCKTMSFDVKEISTTNKLADELEADQKKNNIKLIIIDIMLYSVQSLSSIGISKVSTDNGMLAGWAIIEHFLRPKEKGEYSHIPILIVSTRLLNGLARDLIDEIRERKGEWIEYIEKGHSSNDKDPWIIQFKQIIEKLK